MPPCAGECRFVRVARVLDASWTRTCVALVLAAAARPAAAPAPRTRPCHIGTRARPRLPTPANFTRCRQRPEERLPPATRWPAAIPLPPRPCGNDPPRRTKHAPTDQKHPYRIGALTNRVGRQGGSAQVSRFCAIAVMCPGTNRGHGTVPSPGFKEPVRRCYQPQTAGSRSEQMIRLRPGLGSGLPWEAGVVAGARAGAAGPRS